MCSNFVLFVCRLNSVIEMLEKNYKLYSSMKNKVGELIGFVCTKIQ